MANLIDTEILTGTAASGSLSLTTRRMTGILRQVLCKPATAPTTYDIKLTNDQSIVIYERLSEANTLAEEVALPILGIYTITISNATVDEAFTVELVSVH